MLSRETVRNAPLCTLGVRIGADRDADDDGATAVDRVAAWPPPTVWPKV
jgi:hypothetical protein